MSQPTPRLYGRAVEALRSWHDSRRPLTFERFLQTLQGMTDHSHGCGAGDGTFTCKTLLVAGMHFMDAYNYDIERVKRCVIHYSAPNGMVYPFCTYNSGPYRHVRNYHTKEGRQS